MGNSSSHVNEQEKAANEKSGYTTIDSDETKCNEEQKDNIDLLAKATTFKKQAQELKERLEIVEKDPNVKDFLGAILCATPDDVSGEITKFEEGIDKVKLQLVISGDS